MSRIAVLGAGAWGTALALSLARRGGHQILLWSHSPALADQLSEAGENLPYLPGFTLPVDIHVTSDLPRAIFEADILLCVTPSQHLRGVLTHIAPLLTRGQIILSASKGIEETSFLRMSQVVASVTSATRNPFAVLSGPSFAQEVAAGMPTAVVVASEVPQVAQTIQRDFTSPSLRVYTNEDVPGVELGGSLKNVIALAAGVAIGLNLGHNSSAALITRGIAEMTRLAVACGGRRQTLAGLSGAGDLILTCTGSLSRNRAVGIELGRGRQLPDIIAGLNGKVAEGVRSTAAALGLAARYAVEMPITEQVDAILHHNKSPKEAIRELMARPGRDE
ncbi:NAD(P)H-dependent glycerol-3-phosphate dehydrogenase [Tunturiibacter empetritectus]|uniref:Glycerol-3-phosphate dehydrogenase [NAD(P)+] n=1 Tax=Tunturiibacter lichenicola TaxID=2051959 RepID=A0A852VLM3_9BACT|nr:NAD(P)H-dependent glycerol-3-phosphate dehydrogenase [Edaphobacter lichenicola]NYF90322.1 glycerol-3-phosphate dehydrogenase (NAD(P)+) [Edaphobacter lichenicola]